MIQAIKLPEISGVHLIKASKIFGVSFTGLGAPEIEYYGERILKGEKPPRGCKKKHDAAKRMVRSMIRKEDI